MCSFGIWPMSRCVLFVAQFLVMANSQKRECSNGGVVCCVSLYAGKKNFYNEAKGRCEAVIRECPDGQQLDTQANACIDVAAALASKVTTATSSTTTAVVPSGCTPPSNSSCQPSADCGSHGHSDPRDPTRCVCDDGWTTNALSGGKCSTEVIQQSKEVESADGNFLDKTQDVEEHFFWQGFSHLIVSQGPIALVCMAGFLVCSVCCICRVMRSLMAWRARRAAEDRAWQAAWAMQGLPPGSQQGFAAAAGLYIDEASLQSRQLQPFHLGANLPPHIAAAHMQAYPMKTRPQPRLSRSLGSSIPASSAQSALPGNLHASTRADFLYPVSLGKAGP
eukprot:TRINITY_DN21113_c0_g1_i2.p1 TRINITY_DN21113_c0_g1~~TRINITY_DN21113_c0_g1_i2.p1  ORF type:complete len:335 (-),score=45.09 TRINITY_DN21113_c0_g1_i2:127-1131(-)